MTTSDAATPGETTAPARRSWGPAKLFDLVLVIIAHVLVLAAWALTATAIMGSVAIGRRIVMNSEGAFDTGRLPQPWAIAVGVVAVVVTHRLFRWSMRRYSGGVAAYGASVVAWCGIVLGVVWGAYNWAPPVMIGRKVGPSSGQSTPWDLVGWAAYYARLWLPALVVLVTAALIVASRQSPWRALLRARRDGRRRRAAGRAIAAA